MNTYMNLYSRVKDEFQSSPKSKNPSDGGNSIIGKVVFRPIGLLLAPIFIMLGMTANQVSFLSIVVGTISNMIFLLQSGNALIVGGVLYVVFAILDFTDGLVARHYKKSTFHGKVIDAVSGILVSSFTPFMVGYGCYVSDVIPDYLSPQNYIFIACMAAIVNLINKLIASTYGEASKQVVILSGRSDAIDVDAVKQSIVSKILFHTTSSTTHLLLLALILLQLHYLYPVFILLISIPMLVLTLKNVVIAGKYKLTLGKP